MWRYACRVINVRLIYWIRRNFTLGSGCAGRGEARSVSFHFEKEFSRRISRKTIKRGGIKISKIST